MLVVMSYDDATMRHIIRIGYYPQAALWLQYIIDL